VRCDLRRVLLRGQRKRAQGMQKLLLPRKRKAADHKMTAIHQFSRFREPVYRHERFTFFRMRRKTYAQNENPPRLMA
jgi:hypothetical protein